MDRETLKEVFDLTERCHTGLADIFPHEGTRAIGGSRIFIGSALFPVLKNCFKSISKQSRKWANVEARNTIDSLSTAAGGLLIRIEREGRQGDAEQIDEAVRLLYLANGTMWNFLRGFVADEPPHNPQYIRVEPMEPLLKRCGRESKTEGYADPKRLVQQISAELNACLRKAGGV